MPTKLLLFSVCALAALCGSSQAAGSICGPSQAMYATLWRDFEEERYAVGVNGPNLLELFVSKKGLTASLLVTTPRGVSCIIVTAVEFQSVRPEPLPMPADKPL